jgi:hypothetical protein
LAHPPSILQRLTYLLLRLIRQKVSTRIRFPTLPQLYLLKLFGISLLYKLFYGHILRRSILD